MEGGLGSIHLANVARWEVEDGDGGLSLSSTPLFLSWSFSGETVAVVDWEVGGGAKVEAGGRFWAGKRVEGAAEQS